MITLPIAFLVFIMAIVGLVVGFTCYWVGKDSASKELYEIRRRCREAEARLHLLSQRR